MAMTPAHTPVSARKDAPALPGEGLGDKAPQGHGQSTPPGAQHISTATSMAMGDVGVRLRLTANLRGIQKPPRKQPVT